LNWMLLAFENEVLGKTARTEIAALSATTVEFIN